MGGDKEQIQKTVDKQELKSNEIKVTEKKEEKNAGIAPVINPELEKFNVKQPKKKIPFFPEEEKTLGQIMGEAVNEYDKRLKADAKNKKYDYVKLDKIENLSMKELLDLMDRDMHTKHKAFRDMEGAFKALVHFGENLEKSLKAGTLSMDYNDVFRLAENTAKFYQVSHKKSVYGTGYGKERYLVSCRILDILAGLKIYSAKVTQKIGALEDMVDRVDIVGILDENSLTGKEKGEIISDWLENGEEYKDVLKKILTDEKLIEKDTETLARIVADKNRRLVANKVSMSMVCDENPQLTLGLNSLKDKLRKYIASKIDADDESKKTIFDEVGQFRQHLGVILDAYKVENKDLLEKADKRKQKFISELAIEENDSRFWDKDEINSLILDSDDAVFEIKLDILKGQCADNRAIIDQMIDELGYSSMVADSVKEKVRRELGVVYISGGEILVAERVKDCIREMKYLAADEYEAERRIDHLMNVCQIPMGDKEAFANYLSKNGTVEEILSQKASTLRKRADRYVENLKGLKTTENLCRTKNLMLKEETWEKIENLKNRMGSLDKRRFKSELDRILKDNDKSIDLSKPNIPYSAFYKSRTHERKRRDIGFTARIMGDFFLESEEITEILTKDEIQYFKENIISRLCSGKKDIGTLEFLPTGSIRAIAGMLKKNLTSNRDFIKELREELKDSPAVINEVLMAMSMSTDNLNVSDLNDIVQSVKERHAYDNRLEEEKGKMLGALKAGGSNDGTLSKDRYLKFIKQLNHLKTCNQGRYALIAEQLASENEVFKFMMEGNSKTLDIYLKDVLEPKIGTAIDAIASSDIRTAFKQIYIDKKFKDIFSGKLSGSVAVFKDNIRKEQKLIYGGLEFDEKAVEKNILDATNEVARTVIDGKKEKADKLPVVYSCVEAVVGSCYEDKEKIKILTSRVALVKEINKAFESYDDNRDMLEVSLRELGQKEGSIFYGYGMESDGKRGVGYLNAASFISSISKKMMLTEKNDLTLELPALIENFEKTYKKNSPADRVSAADDLNIGKEISNKKADEERIRTDRDKLLGLFDVRDDIQRIFSNKALVTIDTGKATSLSHDNWKKARDYVSKKLSPIYSFDAFLVDLLVEKNVNEVFNKDIDVHAKWLYNVSDILATADEKEAKISSDEHRLLVVNAYRNMEKFGDPDRKGQFLSDRKSIKGEWYKSFRKNYAELKKLENLKLDHAPLEQERIGLTRDLRAILATGIGMDDTFAQKTKQAIKYLSYINDFMKCADEVLLGNEYYRKENRVIQNEYILGLRRYYHDRIFEELGNDDNSTFDAKAWKSELTEFAKDNIKVRHLYKVAINEPVTGKNYKKKNRNFSELIGRDTLEKLINEQGSRGCKRKYNKLNEEEKELFALGLMLMEKGAIGFDAGSVSVLSNRDLREKEVTPRLQALAGYIAGEDYDFKVDYTQAYYKLTNTGENSFGNVKTAFSKSAFDKALEFAKAVSAKTGQKNEKVTKEDRARMGDGISSIYEAAILGKNKQIDEVDQIRKNQFTPSSVKEKLLEYAELDSKKLKGYERFLNIADGTLRYASGFIGDKVKKTYLYDTREEIECRKRVVKKLSEMDDIDMHRLLAILQNRSVLDDSAAGGGKHIDEEKREEIKLLFSEDNQDRAFEKFVKHGACMQAIISALSFKIEDKRTLKGNRLTKADFDSKSFNRRSLVDWRLLDKAFGFLEELEKDRLTRFAIRNAPNYIEASGNKKAIDAYKENVKGKAAAEIKRENLEEFLKKEAEKDRLSKDNADAKIALSGYKKLSEQQKKLFYKVLGRRDFLDISKKNLYLNNISASRERNFANETGRFRLIDEYIEKSMRGNEGVTLSETAYADAFKSLLSTQVDDTADFKSADSIGDVLAKEKYYIMKRDTAVDWKLFVRALQFVNRATYELEMREGNDEIYRSAGDITRYGHLSMDYSVLRKNIHNSGNQFIRFGAQQSKKLLTEDAIGDIKIIGDKSFTQLKNEVKTAAEIILPALADKMNYIDDILKVEKTDKKRISDLPEWLTKDPKSYNFKKMAIDKAKDMMVGTIYTDGDSFTNQINELVLSAFSEGIKVDKIGNLIKNKIMEKPEPGKSKRLDEIIGDYKNDYQHGDVRDEIEAITGKYAEYSLLIKNYPDKVKKAVYEKLGGDTMKQIIDLKVASSVKEAIENQYAKATAYVLSQIKYENGKITGNIADKPIFNEVKGYIETAIQSQKDASQYLDNLKKKPQELVDKVQKKAQEMTGTILEGAIGKENLGFIREKTEVLKNFGDSMLSKVSWVVDKINKYKVYIDGFRDIALSIKNKKLLSEAQDKAVSEETRQKDTETLQKADAFVDERQKKVRNNAVEEHRDMQKLSGQTAETIQNLAIADDVVKMSMALGQEIFGKLDAGVATKLVTAAVNAGIEFAFYCIRCVKDWKMMKTYYTDTDRGSKVVSDIKKGYEELAGSKEIMEAELMDRDTLDIVCLGNGYENRDELIRDTGMKMATSIAFCASNYNPVKETRVMATTVMIVLGLKDKIGKTDVATISGIFDKMKAS